MKILQINNAHFVRGGADVVYFNTAKLLKENGHEVFFFSIKHHNNIPYSNSDYFAEGIDYHNLSQINKIKAIPSFIYNREAYAKLIHYVDEIKPDIAHIHLFLGGLSSSILKALKKRNIPVVHSVHDYRLICPAYTFLDKNNKICEKCRDGHFYRCAINRCSLENKFSHSAMLALDGYFRNYIVDPFNLIDRFIFVSQFSKNKHISFNEKYRNKAEVLYNFKTGYIRPSLKRGDYILFYGRLSREKGIETLIQSAINGKYKLLVIGKGPLLEKYKDENYGNIEFLGFKQGQELWDLVINSSFVVVPSEWYENNPLTIVEAFSLGKPVIGANIGGIPELIKGKNGYLFDSQKVDSLTNIVNLSFSITDLEYNTISHSAYEFALNNFSEKSHYDKLINIYNTVIHDK